MVELEDISYRSATEKLHFAKFLVSYGVFTQDILREHVSFFDAEVKDAHFSTCVSTYQEIL